MSRPARICSILNCGRTHYAKGYCQRCYMRLYRKARRNGFPARSEALKRPLVVVGTLEMPIIPEAIKKAVEEVTSKS